MVVKGGKNKGAKRALEKVPSDSPLPSPRVGVVNSPPMPSCKKGKDGGKTGVLKNEVPARKKKIRFPKSIAVVITLPPGLERKCIKYAEVITEAKSQIRLLDFGIVIRYRVAITGGWILEVLGAKGVAKADCLAEKLQTALAQREVKISGKNGRTTDHRPGRFGNSDRDRKGRPDNE